ncbi:MAG: TrmH family RNA methyltransferase, partial [Thermoanaerobaculia bacterium]
AGLDYWPRVRPVVWPGWDALEERLPELGAPFFFTSEAGRLFWDVEYPRPAVLVFGRESVGLDPALRERYRDRLVRVPMADPELRSLNLSTCAGVAMYEVLRQHRSNPA